MGEFFYHWLHPLDILFEKMNAPFRSVRQWWTQTNRDKLMKSQNELLTSLIRTPVHKSSSHILNTVEYAKEEKFSSSTGQKKTVVLTHGFGSGLGFYFSNVDLLLQHPGIDRVLLVDWLGMGGSDRPPCRRSPIRSLWSGGCFSLCESEFASPSRVVDFFLDPLHECLADRGVSPDELILVGHSLGGYLAARYALRHPGVRKLVLASPVGFSSKPADALPQQNMPLGLRVVDVLWSANVTPQQLIRMMGSTRGQRTVKRILGGRIPHLNEPRTLDLLANYLYHITVAYPSGEFAMNSLLEPVVSTSMSGVYAREPLDERFLSTADPFDVESFKVVYGDHDWMRHANETSARHVVSQLVQKKNNNKASIHILPNAGHHLYLDNSSEFIRLVVED